MFLFSANTFAAPVACNGKALHPSAAALFLPMQNCIVCMMLDVLSVLSKYSGCLMATAKPLVATSL